MYLIYLPHIQKIIDGLYNVDLLCVFDDRCVCAFVGEGDQRVEFFFVCRLAEAPWKLSLESRIRVNKNSNTKGKRGVKKF